MGPLTAIRIKYADGTELDAEGTWKNVRVSITQELSTGS